MSAPCFSIAVLNPESALSEFNAFFRADRVLATGRRLVHAGTRAKGPAPNVPRAAAWLRGAAR